MKKTPSIYTRNPGARTKGNGRWNGQNNRVRIGKKGLSRVLNLLFIQGKGKRNKGCGRTEEEQKKKLGTLPPMGYFTETVIQRGKS